MRKRCRMKRKQIEKVPLKTPGKTGNEVRQKRVTAQIFNEYLILDLWVNGAWRCRHAMDVNTGEYASYFQGGVWTTTMLRFAFCDSWSIIDEDRFPISKKDRQLVLEALKVPWKCSDIYERIAAMESDYASEYRERKEWRRVRRVNDLMDSVPAVGTCVYDWIGEKVAGSLHYAILDKESGAYRCTDCGGEFEEKETGIKMKHRGWVACPLCHRNLAVEKKMEYLSTESTLTLIHELDEKRGIQRHFVVTVSWHAERTVRLREIIRCMLHKGEWSRYSCDTYYAIRDGWDNKNRPSNIRYKSGYLYPDGIREGMEHTAYSAWTDVFCHMASMGMRANYNTLLAYTSEDLIGVTEYLAKGRFRRLLEEMSGSVGNRTLNVKGKDICGVMLIQDMQKINRLRQEDGGLDMLDWLQWADRKGKRIGSDTIAWYGKNKVYGSQYRCSRAAGYLSPEQLMHYLERQRKESYGGKRTIRAVFEAYEDYLSMAENMGKDMSDMMVYRPRELKRRHDEAVEEYIKYREAEKARMDMEEAMRMAEEMEEKYPGSEAILAEVAPKYEYEGEQFRITVPRSFCDITLEGMALHHCVGNTERYFDRILQHETYICFLRRTEEPEKPYYTIEVEPGGTIRQHRGMLDEEPGIEEIKPFLREWQKEIRKRMKEEDHEHARLSAVKREQNLEELRRKNNTRVLEGLMEDLMEVV